MSEYGPSPEEMGIVVAQPAEAKEEAEPSKSISPSELLPKVDSKAELDYLRQSVGISRDSELQRSKFYRDNRQVDHARDFIRAAASQGSEADFNILNIGPANAQEATVLGVLMFNAGLLDRTHISFVDLATREMVHPKPGPGDNFIGQAIEPPLADRSGFVFESGHWLIKPEVSRLISKSLDGEGNSFGTAVEEYCKKADGKKYKMVTFSNVAQYLGRGATKYDNPCYKKGEGFGPFQAVLLSVAERTEKDGLLLMGIDKSGAAPNFDAGAVDRYLHEGTNFDDVFETVDKKIGVYKRKSDEVLVMKGRV